MKKWGRIENYRRRRKGGVNPLKRSSFRLALFKVVDKYNKTKLYNKTTLPKNKKKSQNTENISESNPYLSFHKKQKQAKIQERQISF